MPFRNKKFELSPRLKSGIGRGHSQNQILKLAAIICLILAVILTAQAIKLIFTNKNPAVEQAVLGASDIKNPSPQATSPSISQSIQYTVQPGDTLFSISQKYNITWNVLASMNNLAAPYYLHPDQVLQIPNNK